MNISHLRGIMLPGINEQEIMIPILFQWRKQAHRQWPDIVLSALTLGQQAQVLENTEAAAK